MWPERDEFGAWIVDVQFARLRDRLVGKDGEVMSSVDVDLTLSISLSYMRRLEEGITGSNFRNIVTDRIAEACRTHGDMVIATLGRVLRRELYPASWVSTETGRRRHRLLDCLAQLSAGQPHRREAVVYELSKTVLSALPLITPDVKAQSADLLRELTIQSPEPT